MTDQRIRRVVIVGGGTAGWMAAAALGRFLDNGFTDIELIESEAIGTVGVGEATIPPIRHFLQLLHIPETMFLDAVGGSYKLGIEFVDWTRAGHRYFHPFGELGADVEGIPFHQFWLRQFARNPDLSIDHWSLTAEASRTNRFGPIQNRGFPWTHWAWAYHFDATRVAAFLRHHAEGLGVKRTEGMVESVQLGGEDGFIESVTLKSGDRVAGDLFIDCSGFRSLLLGEALQEPYEDWSSWLPCDRAVAVASPVLDPLPPYTRATADTAGWRWRIPLRERTGNGHVYASHFMDEDRAVERLIQGLEGEAMGEPRMLRFTTGHRRSFWRRNCVALGLAGGFLEPLESTAIHLVQTGIAKLLALFPDRSFATAERSEYNRVMRANHRQVRDFLILHYWATERDDSEFWRHCRNIELPDSLAQKIDLFREAGRCFKSENDLFSVTSWVAVMLGQGIRPRRVDDITRVLSDEQLGQLLSRMKERIEQAASQLPDHHRHLISH